MKESENVPCPHCEKTFASKLYLNKHVRRMHLSTEQKRVKVTGMLCKICGKTFPRLSHLQRHQASHMNVREWGCPFCPERCVQKSNLMRHISRYHPLSVDSADLKEKINSNRWNDEPVASTSTDLSDLASEPKDDLTADNPVSQRHLCCHCGSTFLDRRSLDKHHFELHKPLACNHCNLTFGGRTELKKHKLAIQGDVFVCKCGVSYTKWPDYEKHHQKCRGQGRFLCRHCSLIFVQRVQLDRHWVREHFAKKTCVDCDWTAANPLRLAAHMKEIHQKHSCGFCGLLDPSDGHISEAHWVKLKKRRPVVRGNLTIPIPNSQDVKTVETKKVAESDFPTISTKEIVSGDAPVSADDDGLTASQDSKNGNSPEDDNLADVSSNPAPFLDFNLPYESDNYEDSDDSCAPFSEENPFYQAENEDPTFFSPSFEHFSNDLLNMSETGSSQSEPSTSQSDQQPTDSSTEVVLNFVVTVPQEADQLLIGSRLPADLLSIFPDLRDLVVCGLTPYAGVHNSLSLHVPLRCSANVDVSKWVGLPIVI